MTHLRLLYIVTTLSISCATMLVLQCCIRGIASNEKAIIALKELLVEPRPATIKKISTESIEYLSQIQVARLRGCPVM